MSDDRTPDQDAYDAKVEQIATTVPPRLVAGPFSYHKPVTNHTPDNQ